MDFQSPRQGRRAREMPDVKTLRKAAVLLISLPPAKAAQVLGRLTKRQIEMVSIELAKIGPVSSDEQERVIYEFAEANPYTIGEKRGSFDLAASLVNDALGKEAKETVDNVRRSVESMPFGFLKNIDPQNVQTFISDESPQAIALILSHLPPAYGAEIISNLPAEKQVSVIRRVAKMGQTSPEVIQEVEQGLENRMATFLTQSFNKAGGVGNVAEILNVTDRATERTLLDNLAQEDMSLVDEIRRLMFVFEDISKLGDKDIQQILKNVENSQWACALKGASDTLREKILGNMSERAATMLMEEIDFLGAVKRSEVEAVQQQIVDIVRQLEDAGLITTDTSDESEEMLQ